MRLFKRKNQLERLLDAVDDALDIPNEIKRLPKGGSGKALKAGLIAAGVAGLTAGSAGISSLRRRKEGARDDS
jgi:hypothetical protein